MATANQPFAIAMALELVSLGFLLLGADTLRSDIKSHMRQTYMATCLCLTVWGGGYGFMTIAASLSLARWFWAVGFAACCMMFPCWMHFLLYIADVPLPRRSLWTLPFYLISAFLAAMSVASGNVEFVHTEWGNRFVYTGGWPRTTLIFIMFEVVIFCVLQIYWWRAPKPKRQRRQAFVFLVLTFVVAPISLVLEFIWPGFLSIPAVPLATLPLFIMATLLYRTVRINNGLDVTLESAAVIAMQTVRVPTLLLNAQNNVVMSNEAAKTFWNAQGALPGKHVTTLLKINGRPPAEHLFDADIPAQKAEVDTPQGPRVCEMQLIVILDKYGDVFYKVAVFLDITDQLEALRQAHIASQAKGEFLSRMSHELRTPLNAVTGMLLITKKSIEKNDPSKALDSINRALPASQHLLGIINDVLDMSKIESGKFEITCEPFGLLPTLYEVASIISQRCQESNLTFHHNLAALPDVWVCGDKLRIKQILINILGNAVKFTKAGGAISMQVTARETDGSLALAFALSDNGIGMTPEFLARVFDPFEQADGTGRTGGTGLGMPISKTLAGLMGGDIGVESAIGKGTTFTFTVSLAISEVCMADNTAEAVNYDFSGKQILLVEDVEINRLIMRELLAETGVQIEEAEDGECALDRFAAAPVGYYDLILMDIQMPRMDGYAATQAIRALPRPDAETVPIIAMTANAYQEDVGRALSAGMNGHLAKPVDLDIALSTLAAHLGAAKRA